MIELGDKAHIVIAIGTSPGLVAIRGFQFSLLAIAPGEAPFGGSVG